MVGSMGSDRRGAVALATVVAMGLAVGLALAALAGSGCDSSSGGGAYGGGGAYPVDEARLRDFGDMVVTYVPVFDEKLATLQQYLRDKQTFEKLADDFNSEYALPTDLTLTPTVCGTPNSAYSPADHQIVLCYELLLDALQRFEPLGDDGSKLAAEVWLWVLYHELGHALVDLYDLPVTGMEEDAVDQFSTVFMIDEGVPDYAMAAAIYWKFIDRGTATPEQRANEHSLNAQRMYNILCLVYGADPGSDDAAVIATIPEMKDRLPRCPGEWEQAKQAWDQLLKPWRFSSVL